MEYDLDSLFNCEIKKHSLYTSLDIEDIIKCDDVYRILSHTLNEENDIDDNIKAIFNILFEMKSDAIKEYLLSNIYEIFESILNIDIIYNEYGIKVDMNMIYEEYNDIEEFINNNIFKIADVLILHNQQKQITKIIKELFMFKNDFILKYYDYSSNSHIDVLKKYNTRESQSIIYNYINYLNDDKITPNVLYDLIEELSEHIFESDSDLLLKKLKILMKYLISIENYIACENLKIILEYYGYEDK